MPANELVRLLLDDLRPDGRPDAALGTSGHTVYTKRKLTPGCVTICMSSLTSAPGCALHGCTISSRMPTISISCPPSSSCLLTCHSQKAAKQTAVSHSSPLHCRLFLHSEALAKCAFPVLFDCFPTPPHCAQRPHLSPAMHLNNGTNQPLESWFFFGADNQPKPNLNLLKIIHRTRGLGG